MTEEIREIIDSAKARGLYEQGAYTTIVFTWHDRTRTLAIG